jgi:hypothetical protein
MRCVAIVLACLFAVTARAEESPARQVVKEELKPQPELILESGGKSTRSNIDALELKLPAEIAAAVKEWTGIADLGQSLKVKLIHDTKKPRYAILSGADTGSKRASLKQGERVLADEEFHVRYEEVVAAADERTFFLLGRLEFANPKTARRCVVLCQVEGEKPPAGKEDAIIHPKGTATWTGPIAGLEVETTRGARAQAQP